MRQVLIADDHEVTRRGLGEILRDIFDDVDITEASDGPSVVAALPAKSWDLILLDVMMPDANVLEIIEKIRAIDEAVPVLVLTGATEIEYVVQAMKAGANGLIHKHRAGDELIVAVKRVAAGETYLHPETASEIAAQIGEERQPKPHEKLSPRELEIFRLIALGRAIKEIAGDLALSDKTVATYLTRIREKTGLMSHVDIARYALQNGLVD